MKDIFHLKKYALCHLRSSFFFIRISEFIEDLLKKTINSKSRCDKNDFTHFSSLSAKQTNSKQNKAEVTRTTAMDYQHVSPGSL